MKLTYVRKVCRTDGIFNVENKRESAFRTFIEKMYIAEKSVFECGCFSEEQVEEELDEI